MNKIAAAHKVRWIVILMFVAFAAASAAGTYHRYLAAQKAAADLAQQTASLEKLQAKVDESRQSIEKMKADQEEFRKMLFDERDVPAFLDGFSAYAAKNKIYVAEMKSQPFGRVEVPRAMEEASHKLARARISQGLNEEKKNPKQKLQDMLTLAAMPVQIKIRGTFEDLVYFLNNIETDKQLLTVGNVEISSNRNDYPQLACQFTLRIYSLKKLGDIKS